VATYKEKVTNKSTQICMAKSTNKYNRLYILLKPLDEKFVEEIDIGNIRASNDLKVDSRIIFI